MMRKRVNAVLADVMAVLCCVGGGGQGRGQVGKIFCQHTLCRHPGSLEAVLADLKASGQPLEAARGLMQVVELSNDN